jgi:molybdopterin converting factor small subunit
MAVVVLPGPLRPYADGQVRVALAAGPRTLGETLSLLFERHPRLRDHILTEQGELRPHVNLFVGRENARLVGGLAAPVGEGAEVHVLPAISGG